MRMTVMIQRALFCLSLLLLSQLAAGSDADVLVFTAANFDTQIKEHEVVLVEFYAPWCGHCQRLAPEYEAAATRLKGTVPLAKVDCTAETAVCSRFGVSGYPTLKIFKGGEFSADYQGPRDAEGIAKYMKTKAGPSSRLLTDPDGLTKLLSGVAPFIVGFFADQSSAAYAAFKKTADSLVEDFEFAHSLSPELNAKLGQEADRIVVMQPLALQTKLEEARVAYTGAMDAEEIKQWIQANAFGLVGHRTMSNGKYFGQPLVTAYFAIDFERNAKGTNYWRNRIMKVAKKHTASGLKFSIANAATMSRELAEFGVTSPSTEEQKVLVAAKNAKGQKFLMTGEFSVESFDAFLGDMLAGRLTPYQKSEPVPETQPDHGVQVAVATNFDQLVNDPAKDVLVEFYAPWCGHCQKLAPKYDELAAKLASEPGLRVVKMDATANDVPPPYTVRGYPTLYFSPKGDKANPRQYNGGHEVDDFVRYLAKEATDELAGYDRSGNPKGGKQEL